MRPVVVVVVVAVGLVLAACHSSRPASSAPASTGVAPAPAPDDATLVAPGAGPRTALRYQVAAGTRRKVTWEMRLPATGAQPATTTAAWEYAFQREGDAMGLAMHVTQGEGIVGLEGRWTFSDRGRHAAAASVDARALLQQTQAEHMLPILPLQPVGVGAQWSVPTSLSAGVGVGELPGHTRWELRAVEGSVVVVHGTLDAPETSLPFRDTVITLSAKGTIDARIDLTTFTGESTLVLALQTAGTSFESTVAMRLR